MHPLVLIPISLVFVAAILIGRHELVRRRLACPRKRAVADVEVWRSSLRPGRALAVESCSLLEHPREIDCGQECLHARARPASRRAAARA